MRKYMCGNDSIKIDEIQDSRIWIHSVELGYGCWVRNDVLKKLIEDKSIKMVSSDNVQKASEDKN